MKNQEFWIKYDKFWIKLCKPIVKVWSKVTGRTNYQLARLFAYIGSITAMVLCMAYAIISNFLLANVWFAFCGISYFFILKEVLKFIKAIEESIDILKIPLAQFKRAIDLGVQMTAIGSFLLVYSICTLNIGTVIISLLFLCLGLSTYICCIQTKKRQSVFSRAKDKVKAGAKAAKEKAKDLIPSPIPAPVPIRI